MPEDRYSKHNTTRKSCVVGARFTNQEIDTLENIQRLGGFSSKSEVVQTLLRPAMVQFKTAIETKSVAKAFTARVTEEIVMNRKLQVCMSASEVQTDLFEDMEVAPA